MNLLLTSQEFLNILQKNPYFIAEKNASAIKYGFKLTEQSRFFENIEVEAHITIKTQSSF